MNSISCEIESRSDFLTGMYLIARIPDSELDENALLTIQEDCPDFILPFNYKRINGETEFTYKVGNLCKLQYFYGDITHAEYVALWRGLLTPLLECRDWFMSPCSFVLSADYLYYDKKNKTVAYVYIPSIGGCSGYDAFNEMAVEVAKGIKVSDPVLENKVLRSIINDFNPNDFLKMLSEHAKAEPMLQVCEETPQYQDSEIADDVTDAQEPPPKKADSFKIFSAKSKRGKEAKRNGFKNTVPCSVPAQPPSGAAEPPDATQETKVVMSSTGLRCVGRPQFPQTIEVDIAQGGIFTIGRYDAGAGMKLSNFEFAAKTKAVSRRHAAIERDASAYKIVDLSSSAGTFVNDRKLPPNTPVELEPGCRVSFGNMGADYVWELG